MPSGHPSIHLLGSGGCREGCYLSTWKGMMEHRHLPAFELDR